MIARRRPEQIQQSAGAEQFRPEHHGEPDGQEHRGNESCQPAGRDGKDARQVRRVATRSGCSARATLRTPSTTRGPGIRTRPRGIASTRPAATAGIPFQWGRSRRAATSEALGQSRKFAFDRLDQRPRLPLAADRAPDQSDVGQDARQRRMLEDDYRNASQAHRPQQPCGRVPRRCHDDEVGAQPGDDVRAEADAVANARPVEDLRRITGQTVDRDDAPGAAKCRNDLGVAGEHRHDAGRPAGDTDAPAQRVGHLARPAAVRPRHHRTGCGDGYREGPGRGRQQAASSELHQDIRR